MRSGSVEQLGGGRFELKRDRSWLFGPLIANAALSWILIWAIVDNWGIVAILAIAAGLFLFWVLAEAVFRVQNYVILHELHVDVRELPWGDDPPKRFRIQYRSISFVSADNSTVSLEFSEDASNNLRTLTVRPVDPAQLASRIKSRVETAKGSKQIAGRQRDPLEGAHGQDWLKKVENVFQREWRDVVDAAREIRVTGGLNASLIDDFDCLGVNHFHNLFGAFFNDLFPRSPGISDGVRNEERKAVLRFAKDVNDYRNAMSHPSEHDLPLRDATRLLDSAHRLLGKIDPIAASQILDYENQLRRIEPQPRKLAHPTGIQGPPRLPPSLSDEVLVVAAQRARDDYYTYSAYICQPNRAFRSAARLAFYTNGRILTHVPRIRGVVESVSLTEAGLDDINRTDLDLEQMEEAKALLLAILRDQRAGVGRSRRRQAKFVLLSAPNDDETLKLPREIANDKRDYRGRPTAFTQSQRYVSLAKLQQATVTSELE